MKRAHFYWLTFLVVLLFVGISMVSMAEEPVVLRIEISDVVSNADALQIRRLLKPWADPKDITFSTPVDKHGRKRLFTTVVEVKPRHGVNEYSETHTFDVYDIMKQLNDSRFRGRHGIGGARVLKTEATIRGHMFAHPVSRGVISETFRRGDAGDLIPLISSMHSLQGIRDRNSFSTRILNSINFGQMPAIAVNRLKSKA